MARPAGSVNKKRGALEARLLERFPEWNPIIQMAEIANDPEADTVQQLQACREVAQYLYPKLKAVEVNLEGQIDARLTWRDSHSILAEAITSDPA